MLTGGNVSNERRERQQPSSSSHGGKNPFVAPGTLYHLLLVLLTNLSSI